MRHTLLGLFVVLCILGTCTPFAVWVKPWFGPRLLGLPFFFGWNAAWILASLLALFLYDRGGRAR